MVSKWKEPSVAVPVASNDQKFIPRAGSSIDLPVCLHCLSMCKVMWLVAIEMHKGIQIQDVTKESP